MKAATNRDVFELRRQSDDLVYTFRKAKTVDGTRRYKRSDGEYWIIQHRDHGWVAWDYETESIMGRPWEAPPEMQADFPPEGDWVSRKGPKSYVYSLVYV